MEKFSIRSAQFDDIPLIMRFIGEYWKKGHILAENRVLFEWQYVDGNNVNFVLGFDEMGNIQGILGFVSYDVSDDKDIALALWKANHAKTFLGIKLLMFLMKEVPHRNIVCPGINLKTTAKIYQQFGMYVDTMRQWYRLRELSSYGVARIVSGEIPEYRSEQFELERITTYEEMEKKFDFSNYAKEFSVPYKSANYIKKRYFNHPVYEYLVYGMGKERLYDMFIVLRIQEYKGTNILRFVDCIGDVNRISNITNALDELLCEFDAEYIDMYEAGLSEQMLIDAGWLLVKTSGNVIPNYFAPFEQNNVDIHYCTSNKNAVLFRGDGDQDRPN